MGKMDEYIRGRADGLQLALKIVEKDGIEALKKEIKFRGITGINTSIAKKELEVACESIKQRTVDTLMVLSIAVLHDEFGFGEKRLMKFHDRFMLKTECLLDDMATWEDYIDMIREETGLNLQIRWRPSDAKNNRE